MRKRHASSVGPFLLIALAASAPAPAPAASPPAQLTVVYTADLGGHLEPCGCTVDQRGGLARMAAVLARIRAEGQPVVFLGGGDLLFDGRPEGEERRQAISAARTAAKALRRMRLDATLSGERDAYLGPAFLSELGLPVTDGRLLSAGATKVGFGPLGRVPPAAVRLAVLHEGGTRAGAARAEEARRGGVSVLFTSHRANLLDDDVNRVLLDGPVPRGPGAGPRAVAGARRPVPARRSLPGLRGPAGGGRARRGARAAGGPAGRVRAPSRRRAGRAAGELAQALAAKLEELAGRARRAPVEAAARAAPGLPFAPGELHPAHPGAPRGPGRARAPRAPPRGGRPGEPGARPGRGEALPAAGARRADLHREEEAPHGGVSSCKGCHPEAVAQWETTEHARAWATLVKGGRTTSTSTASPATSPAGRSPAARAASPPPRAGATCSRVLPRPGQPARLDSARPHRARSGRGALPDVPHARAFDPLRGDELLQGRDRAGHGDGLRGRPRPP